MAAAGVVLLALVACSTDETDVAVAPSSDTGAPTTAASLDFAELIDDVTPLAEPLGWEVQRAYRVDAAIVSREGVLVNIYLRPSGEDASPDEYLADATTALQVMAADVFAADPSVSAIDVCLQRPNDEPPEVAVAPALRILAYRDGLEPLLDTELRPADLVRLSRERRLVIYLDEYVEQSADWADALAAGTTVP